MSCLGGFRAITKEELDKLRSVPRAQLVQLLLRDGPKAA